jgi:D-inositol-3-phosphate glycosyltransferase
LAELVGPDADLAKGPKLPIQLVIMGSATGDDYTQHETLQPLAQRLGIAHLVRFEPPAGRRRLADWYRAADLVCVPSYNESFGLVALEAQACGTPVLAARVGGLRAAVKDGITGTLVSGHDPRRWSRAIREMLDDRLRLDRMGQQAARRASDYGWERTAAATLRLYSAALTEHRRELRVGRPWRPLGGRLSVAAECR